MIFLKKIGIILGAIVIIGFGIFVGFKISEGGEEQYNKAFNNNMIVEQQNIEISTQQVSTVEEEKTTPNTLIIYKIYYTKCKHYIHRYEDIDASLVNLTEKEFKEKCKKWNIDKFSIEEIELSKEEECFCNEHYKLKLENNAIVIYSVDENGRETEYEQTGVTIEYLTQQDILQLTTGILIYGKENLNSTIEDYE
jgi:hypothetical protein